jgi:PKD repeat protein
MASSLKESAHKYEYPGSYVAKAQVISGGRSAVSTITIEVYPEPVGGGGGVYNMNFTFEPAETDITRFVLENSVEPVQFKVYKEVTDDEGDIWPPESYVVYRWEIWGKEPGAADYSLLDVENYAPQASSFTFYPARYPDVTSFQVVLRIRDLITQSTRERRWNVLIDRIVCDLTSEPLDTKFFLGKEAPAAGADPFTAYNTAAQKQVEADVDFTVGCRLSTPVAGVSVILGNNWSWKIGNDEFQEGDLKDDYDPSNNLSVRCDDITATDEAFTGSFHFSSTGISWVFTVAPQGSVLLFDSNTGAQKQFFYTSLHKEVVFTNYTIRITTTPSDNKFVEGEEIHFSATGDIDTSHNLEYYWDFGDGVQSNDAAPSHSYTTTGATVYRTVKLIVIDRDLGLMAKDEMVLTIVPHE